MSVFGSLICFGNFKRSSVDAIPLFIITHDHSIKAMLGKVRNGKIKYFKLS